MTFLKLAWFPNLLTDLQGMKLDDYTEKRFCRAAISNLPTPFRRGNVKATAEFRTWYSWKKMKEDLYNMAEAASMWWWISVEGMEEGQMDESEETIDLSKDLETKPTCIDST